MRKRLLSFILLVALIFSAIPVPAAEDTVSISGKAAIVIDYDTGYMIYGKNPDTPRAPASMTKIMSLYAFFKRMDQASITLDTPVTISKSIAELSVKPGLSNVPFREGEVQTVDTLIRAACIVSANAAIVALGSLVGGSEAGFVAQMNADAAELGLVAKFYDPAGLSNDNYITPRSMAELCRRIIRDYPQILDYTSLKSFTFKGTTYSSTNKLLDGLSGAYPGTDGMKTGYIGVAGYCLSATSKRENRRVIAVTMGASGTSTRTSDGYALLRYGFRNIEQTIEPIYDIGGSFTASGGETRVVLKNVPQAFSAQARWIRDGQVLKHYGYAWIDNGSEFSIDDEGPGLELVISVGPYNILVKP